MINELILTDEEYYECLQYIETFAENHKLEYNPSVSKDVIRIALVMMLADECMPEVQVLLAKVIYNMGYRDNYALPSSMVH